jgi:hypothetical protein
MCFIFNARYMNLNLIDIAYKYKFSNANTKQLYI